MSIPDSVHEFFLDTLIPATEAFIQASTAHWNYHTKDKIPSTQDGRIRYGFEIIGHTTANIYFRFEGRNDSDTIQMKAYDDKNFNLQFVASETVDQLNAEYIQAFMKGAIHSLVNVKALTDDMDLEQYRNDLIEE
ncbi:hypothetical protein [Flaviaesturariibacter amylovorans]|uniref:SRPBCC family protein n=1 Tax=Flaviaesturariibacter amylovorans TaxID=1084520 RepID=A0ABP8GLI6_9BACT